MPFSLPSKTVSLFLAIALSLVATSYPAVAHASIQLDSNLTVGDSPFGIVLLGTKMYVSNLSSNSVSIIDTQNGNSISSISVGPAPDGIFAFNNKIYTINHNSSSISIIDTSNGNSVTTLSSGLAGPDDAVMVGGAVFVTNSSNSNLRMYDYSTNAGFNIPLGYSQGHSYVLGTNIYVTHPSNGRVSVIDTANGNAVSSFAVGTNPTYITSIGSKLYITDSHQIDIVDTANSNAVSTISLSSNIRAITAVGAKVYFSRFSSNDVGVMDTANGNAVSSISTGAYTFDIKAFGTNVVVTNESSNSVSIIDTANNDSVTTVGVQSSPTYFAVSGNYLYVANSISNSVSVINLNYTAPPAGGFSTQYQYDYANGILTTTRGGDVSTSTIPKIILSALPASASAFTQAPSTLLLPAVVSMAAATTSTAVNASSLSATPTVIAVPTSSTSTPLIFLTTEVSSVAARYSFNTNLQYRDSSTDVLKLQQFLQAQGHLAVAPNGNFGSATKAALIKFQKANHIMPAVGYFGSVTRGVVNSFK